MKIKVVFTAHNKTAARPAVSTITAASTRTRSEFGWRARPHPPTDNHNRCAHVSIICSINLARRNNWSWWAARCWWSDASNYSEEQLLPPANSHRVSEALPGTIFVISVLLRKTGEKEEGGGVFCWDKGRVGWMGLLSCLKKGAESHFNSHLIPSTTLPRALQPPSGLICAEMSWLQRTVKTSFGSPRPAFESFRVNGDRGQGLLEASGRKAAKRSPSEMDGWGKKKKKKRARNCYFSYEREKKRK